MDSGLGLLGFTWLKVGQQGSKARVEQAWGRQEAGKKGNTGSMAQWILVSCQAFSVAFNFISISLPLRELFKLDMDGWIG